VLGNANINIYESSYSASDLSLNLFVPASDTQKALRVLHTLIQ
jgi:aspartokinase